MGSSLRAHQLATCNTRQAIESLFTEQEGNILMWKEGRGFVNKEC